ncbi:Uncharacterised protein [Vibrio cholerae]|nr:Uncharacterised protein [Vibrio cholerae]
MNRRATLRQIFRAGTQHQIGFAQFPQHEVFIWLIRQAKGDINIVFEQINVTIGGTQLELNMRILGEKWHHKRLQYGI